MVAAAGTSMANHLAMATLIDPGDEVLIEQPTYELLTSTALVSGREGKAIFPDAKRADTRSIPRKSVARSRRKPN